jgi:hypothetical protein
MQQPGRIAPREGEYVSEEAYLISFRHSGARVSANYGAQLRT